MAEVVVRPACRADLDEMVRVENEAWPPEQAFTREHFESQLDVLSAFPDCLQIATVDGAIAGIGVAEILSYDLNNPIPDWYTATDDGFLRKSFDPAGNVLYGVSLSVSPRFSTSKVGKRIVETAKNLVVKYSLEMFILGSRIPRFHKYAVQMRVEDYVFGKRGSHFLDPEIEFYAQCGLRVVKILPNYFDDPQSLNYGVLVVWDRC